MKKFRAQQSSKFLQNSRSLGRKLIKAVLLTIALPVVLVIRSIRPWFVVRIGALTSGRIGHFAGDTELYLCDRDAGINIPKNKYIDLWYFSGWICNQQMARMWKRILTVGPTVFFSLLDRLNGFIPGYEIHKIQPPSRDTENLLDRFPPHLSFLPDEEKLGRSGLHTLGIPDGTPFVCINVRDSAYLAVTEPTKNWRYHDYRDSSIENFVLAAQELVKRGYYVIRMGAAVKDEFPVSQPMIIDYATNGMRTDFMDIYLSAKCDFFVSTGTGIDAVAMAFRRPYVFVGILPLAQCHSATRTHLFITKKHLLRSEKRFMTFREIFESGAGLFHASKQFEEMGIELIQNSPEEIAAVVLEMDDHLAGKWEATEEDEELQKRFWDIFPTSAVHPDNGRPLHGEIRSRIGAEFLRQNKALLE